jgi:hypothetical protein
VTRCCVWLTTYSCKGIGCGVLSTGPASAGSRSAGSRSAGFGSAGCAASMGLAGELRDQVGEGHEVTRCVDAEVRRCGGLDVAE